MKDLVIKKVKGQLVTDSKEVALRIGKEHKNLLRDIKGYIKVLDGSNLSSKNFFIEDTYLNSQNKEQPCYQLTRKGCDMVANKMTGEKGILFTAEYVTAFEKMEQQQFPKLSKELQAIFFLDDKQQKLEIEVKDLKANMPLFQVDCKELQAIVRKKGIEVLGGKDKPAYKDNSIRGKVYSDIQHQLKREFGVSRYEAIKRRQFDIAINIVNNYKAPLVIEDLIKLANDQVKFEEVV